MEIWFKCIPYCREDAALALEAGADGIIADEVHAERIAAMSRVPVVTESAFPSLAVTDRASEDEAAERLCRGERLSIARGWQVIPMENLLARCKHVCAEVASVEEARLACGILERGAESLVVLPQAVRQLKEIIALCRESLPPVALTPAVIRRIERVGTGHRVCADTLTVFRRGCGMLVGNSAAFMFLVHAETEENEFVAPRPFRVNAGSAHCYVCLPDDKTAYAEELRPGAQVLIADSQGRAVRATVGRVKTEVRPMLLIEAEADGKSGIVFLQDAETVRLAAPGGEPISVSALRPGDCVLCRLDEAGRHFGRRIQEHIEEK